MSRKDYILIANALRMTRPNPVVTVYEGQENTFTNHITLDQWGADRGAIMSALSSDNYRFDRDRFIRATEAD